MKVKFETSRFYPCYPVFIVSFYDENRQVKIATYSSSYSLGSMMVLGILKGTTFHSYIEEHTDFSVNFLSRQYLSAIETGGMLYYKRDDKKTEKAKLTFDKCVTIDAPFIKESMLVIECKRENIIAEPSGRYTIIVAHIEERMCEDFLLKNDEFQYPLFDVPLCEGDSTQLVYRFMDSNATAKGSYLP